MTKAGGIFMTPAGNSHFDADIEPFAISGKTSNMHLNSRQKKDPAPFSGNRASYTQVLREKLIRR
ncbi:hypothetical protein [Martelella mediterranea]|uniref:hypothetical protein n=1 Tax=Martelella mediterranea TaxID=293089 RepID=UPI001049FA22|nr:hypothetical protein [Martelella mediterranea]